MHRSALRGFIHRVATVGVPLLSASCFGLGGTAHCTFQMQVFVRESDLMLDGGIPDCKQVCAGRGPESSKLTACSEAMTDGGPAIECDFEITHACGRYPLLPLPVASGATAVSRWLSRAAYIEGRSALAFANVADSLAFHRAPVHLIRAVTSAASDELRHAQIFGRLASGYGCTALHLGPSPNRMESLEDLAIENAVDGCVVETWGARLAEWQSNAARDPAVRAAFSAISGDELRHAMLARALDEWFRSQLSLSSRSRVGDARRTAIVALREQVRKPIPVDLAPIGLPDARLAPALFQTVFGRDA